MQTFAPTVVAAIAVAVTYATAVSPAAAQTPREVASALVQRDPPAQAAFSESVAKRLRVPAGFVVQVIANGLCNTIGHDWHPLTGQLWGMDNGSDLRGDELPPEKLNPIEAGRNYGWRCGRSRASPRRRA